MLGFRRPFPSKLPCVFIAGLMLSALTPASSYAASVAHRGFPKSAHVVAQPYARAQFPSTTNYPFGSDYPFSTDDPNKCIGGYHWVQRFDDANQTPAQSEVPVPCR